MKIPIVKYNNTILNLFFLMKAAAVTLWPFIILSETLKQDSMSKTRDRIIRHESIHIKQQIEMLVIPFYIVYVLEWFIKLFKYGTKSYNNISFERECKANENDLEYLKNRKFWAWAKYL